MTDIVARLRNKATFDCTHSKLDHHEHICWEAAKEIERLRTNIQLIKTMLPPGYDYQIIRREND